MTHRDPGNKVSGGFSPSAVVTAVLAIGGTLAFCLGAYDVLTSRNPAGYVLLFGGSASVAGAQVLHQLRMGRW